MKWSAVILAAGVGVRMKSVTPKPLHRVSGTPMLKLVSDAAREAGLADITVVVNPGNAESADFLEAAGEGARIAVQVRQTGTADALMCARESAGGADAVLVLNSDSPLIRPQTIALLVAAHESAGATVTLATASEPPPVGAMGATNGLGRIIRAGDGSVRMIVEEKDASPEVLKVDEVNAGWYAFDGGWIWDALPAVEPSASGERYLTDVVGAAAGSGQPVAGVVVEDSMEILGVNTRAHLAAAEKVMRERQRAHWLNEGVTMIDPATTYIDASARLAPDVTVHPNSHILGSSTVASGCEIGPNSIIVDTEIGRDSRFISSYADSAVIGERTAVGPFSRLRPGAVLGNDVYVGNFAEIKNSTVGAGTHIGHFSYTGDARLGRRVNIGAGTVTANYDGKCKNRTVIGDDVSVGSGSMLVAPVEIGPAAVTGAGAVVTNDVEAGATVAGVPARPMRPARPVRGSDSTPDNPPEANGVAAEPGSGAADGN